MNSPLLINKIESIQEEYAKLLQNIIPNLEDTPNPVVIDNIKLFWYKNVKIIELYFEYCLEKSNSYVFTASTHMDYENREFIPFLLLGKNHIIDDPLAGYAATQTRLKDKKNAEIMANQIRKTATNNLKILENTNKNIYILPFRLSNIFDYKTKNKLNESGEKLFTSLFKNISSIEDYLKKCESFNDIVINARSDIDKIILFTENDDTNKSFEERFRDAIDSTNFIINKKNSDALNFLILIMGNILQALDVLITSYKYSCIPYIRYPVALYYIKLISSMVFFKQEDTNTIFRSFISYSTQQQFDKERISEISNDSILNNIKDYNFEECISKELLNNGITSLNYDLKSINPIIKEELEKFYNYINNLSSS